MELKKDSHSNILIVDDNPDNIKVLGSILKDAGYAVGYAVNGKQSLDILHKWNDYDLILMDIDMPVMDGYEACKAIRGEEKLKEIPIIFITAFIQTEQKVAGFEAGAQDYITKPFETHELLSRIKTHIELKKSREKLEKTNEWLQNEVEKKTNELKKANDNLNRLNNMKTNFLFQISQEIRSPLNNIVGTVNLIKNQEQSLTIKNMIDTLNNSISQLENFSKQAVFSAQLSSQNYDLKLSEINLLKLIQFAIIELNDTIQKKNIQIVSENDLEIILIWADRDLLFNAMVYILDSAIKYSPPTGEIRIKVSTENTKTSCTFTNCGNGFSMEELSTGYLPFISENSQNDLKLGISIYFVRQVMDLLNGEIYIFNSENEGTCISLIFNNRLI